MRRIFSILIIVFISFLIAMLIYAPLRTIVFNGLTLVLGPAVTGSIAGIVSMLLTNIGLLGFAGLMLGFGLLGGIFVHFLWVKADWSIRTWGAKRTAKDLGATPMTSLPSTPVGATVRPVAAVKAAPKVETKPAVAEPVAEVKPEK